MNYISRKEALKDPIFASFIAGWQYTQHPNNSGISEDEEQYNEEVISFKKITDEPATQEFKLLSQIVIDAPQDTDEIVFISTVIALFVEQHNSELIFIPFFKTSWFQEDIATYHPETKIAYHNFKTHIGKENYKGGIVVSNPVELQKLLPDYFNLVQGNYYGFNFFYSETLKTVLSFHYSGQLLFYVFKEESIKKIETFITNNKLLLNETQTFYSS